MIGQSIVGADGKPLLQYSKLAKSNYQPPDEVRELFKRCQTDYQTAWQLQHRPFDEFDGRSLLERARIDQETFSAFVGAEFVPQEKRWRFKGRKNTARNKLVGILAHMLAGMLYPLVTAYNDKNEEDKLTARAMRIIIENHLKKAGYEKKFLYMVLSALVNPAVLVSVDYLYAMQKIKEPMKDGKIKITEAVDTLLSGLNLSIIPIDQLLLGDFYTNDIQLQPFLVKIERITWDSAKKIYGGRFYQDEKDLFDFVEAGKTRVFLAGNDANTLFDIEYTEADANYVQVATFYYRDEDLEVAWVGGVGMFEYKDCYNSNPFIHRRMSLIGNEWKTIPIYPVAMSGFEPIDPTGRFAYYKSGAFKEYWEDATQNKMHQLLIDGTFLDVIKPLFIDGLAKVDSKVIAPGTIVGMPQGAKVTPFQMGPNLAAAMNAMQIQEKDMAESTQDKLMSGVTEANVTATQSLQAQNQARIIMGPFAVMISDLIRQVGLLVIDCTVQNITRGELDATIPEALKMKYNTMVAQSKEHGKNVTHRIEFTDEFMGRPMSKEEVEEEEYKLYDKAGGEKSDQRIWKVNPYKFARTVYGMSVDPEQITNAAFGLNRQQKIVNHQMLTSQFVYPFTDPKEVANDVIEEFGGSDPDRYKAKEDPMMGMGMMGMGGEGLPSPFQQANAQGGAGQSLSANLM